MAKGKLPAGERFFDAGCRFRRLKKEPKNTHFSISVRMPSDDEHDTWWWSKPKKVQLSAPNAKTELLLLADAYREELQHSQTTLEQITVHEYIERWKTRRKKLVERGEKASKYGKKDDKQLKRSTVERENTTLAHIDDYIGDILLSDLSSADIEAMNAHMTNNGLSRSTRARAHAKLKQLLSQAWRDGLIEENPMDKVSPDEVPTMPQRDEERHEERLVTPAEADALMNAIKQEPPDGLRAAVWLAYTLGLRRGEALGLRWSDFDEGKREVHIKRQMTPKGIDKSTKTYKSLRTLPYEPAVWSYLEKWRKKQQEQYENELPIRDREAGSYGKILGHEKLDWTSDVYVCTNAEGAEWRPSGTFNRGLRHFFVSHKLGKWVVDDEGKRHYHGATLHSLRHTFVTSTLDADISVKQVQGYAGHAQATTTMNIYADAYPDGMREVARAQAKRVTSVADQAEQDPEFDEWMQKNM